jgi:hypothetical protein
MPIDSAQGYLVLAAVESLLENPALLGQYDLGALLSLQKALGEGRSEVLENPRLAAEATLVLYEIEGPPDSHRNRKLQSTWRALSEIIDGMCYATRPEELRIDLDLLSEAVQSLRNKSKKNKRTVLDENGLSLRDVRAVDRLVERASQRPSDWPRLFRRQPDAAAQAYLLLSISDMAKHPNAPMTFESLLPIALRSPWGSRRISPFVWGFDSSLPPRPPAARAETRVSTEGMELYDGILAAISNGSSQDADGAVVLDRKGSSFRATLLDRFPPRLRPISHGDASIDPVLKQSFERLQRGEGWDSFLAAAETFLNETQERRVGTEEVWDALTEGGRNNPMLESLREAMGVPRGEFTRVLDLSRPERLLEGAKAVVRIRESSRPVR